MDHEQPSPQRGQRKPLVRLDAETWAVIRQDWESGLTDRDCEKRHGADHSTVGLRRKREGWTRTPRPAPAPDFNNFNTLDGLLNCAVAEILNVYKAEGHAAAREIAKSAEVFARLNSRLRPPGHPPAAETDADALATFTPEQDVFLLLAVLGLKLEDLR